MKIVKKFYSEDLGVLYIVRSPDGIFALITELGEILKTEVSLEILEAFAESIY